MESVSIPPSSEATETVRSKTSLVWKLFEKDDDNDRAICRICKVIYIHKKGGGRVY